MKWCSKSRVKRTQRTRQVRKNLKDCKRRKKKNSQVRLINKLWKELEEKSERLEDTHRKNEGQEFQIRIDFAKIKTGFQELIARIEIKNTWENWIM